MQGNKQFQIDIVHQGWLDGCSPEQDLCSHGAIKLLIGGTQITAGSEDYGISETALALLRTLEGDHTKESPIAESMIFHGCGMILMMGCGIGVDWDIAHEGKYITIANVCRYDGAGQSDPRPFADLNVKIAFSRYKEQIVAFAQQSRTPFEQQVKRYADTESWPNEYRDFWSEYDRLLTTFGPPWLQPLATDPT